MEILQVTLIKLVKLAILLFEFTGVIVLIVSGIRGVIDLFKRCPETRLSLAKGMATGLEFKLGSEILRTVIIHDMSEIFIIGGIIILRAAIAILIHWEIKNEERCRNLPE